MLSAFYITIRGKKQSEVAYLWLEFNDLTTTNIKKCLYILTSFQVAMNIAKIQKACYKERCGILVSPIIFLQFSIIPWNSQWSPQLQQSHIQKVLLNCKRQERQAVCTCLALNYLRKFPFQSVLPQGLQLQFTGQN